MQDLVTYHWHNKTVTLLVTRCYNSMKICIWQEFFN